MQTTIGPDNRAWRKLEEEVGNRKLAKNTSGLAYVGHNVRHTPRAVAKSSSRHSSVNLATDN